MAFARDAPRGASGWSECFQPCRTIATIIVPAPAGQSTCTGADGHEQRTRTLQAPPETAGLFCFCMIDFSKLDGLVPAVVQDDQSGEVLMVGFMNEAALEQTRASGFATFFSRTRGRLWTKGETSGNRLAVKRILVDCDDDTVLLKVDALGDGVACHTGERSCFFRELT